MKQTVKTQPNLYLILDILPGASHSEILMAYNRAKRTYSGDSLAGYSLIDDDAKSPIMDEIEEAFVVLGNPVKRREYDLSMGFETWKAQDEKDLTVQIDNKAFLSKPSIRTLDEDFDMPGESPRKPSPVAVRPMVKELFEKKEAPVPRPKIRRAEVVALPSVQNSGFEANPEFEAQIAEAEDVDGAFIKALRIYRRLSVEQLAQRCKLQPMHVLAIEDEDQSLLPHTVYLRGHVLMIVQVLDMPQAENVAKNYTARMKMLGKLPKAIF